MIMTTYHTPVLVHEVIQLLNIKPGGRYIDCTLGGGGHASAFLKASAPNGKVLGIDIDSDALEESRRELKNFIDEKQLILAQGNFKNIATIAKENNLQSVNGILLDLGVSSHQINSDWRGFSFQKDGPLQMTFSSQGGDAPNQCINAWEVVNTYPKQKLKQIFKEYGEVSNAGLCAERIERRRKERSIDTTTMLVKAILGPGADKLRGKNANNFSKPRIKLLAKVFQAIRIEVNSELDNLQSMLSAVGAALGSRGRIAVISYHSLEDRIVKQFLKESSRECVCPRELPVCVCRRKPEFLRITKRPIRPSQQEINNNPRSRSAKLRVGEKIFYETVS